MRVAVCYSGQLRWARMVQASQRRHVWEVLRERFQADIDLFVVSDRCNTTRSRLSPGRFQWQVTPVPDDVRTDWLSGWAPYTSSTHVVWQEPGPLDASACRDNLFAQFVKLRDVWNQVAATGVKYDYVVRLRPDVFFDTDLQLPEPGEVLSNLESAYNYKGDSTHVFRGDRLDDVVRWCADVRPEHFPVVHGDPVRFLAYEDLFLHLCCDLGLTMRFVPDMGCRWYGLNCRWFEGLEWRYFSDWLSVEYDFPFSLPLLQEALNQREQRLDWPTYCARWFSGGQPTNAFLQLWASVSPPRWIPPEFPCRDNFLEDCVGLLPCAGTAVRMGQLPKFLLPVPACTHSSWGAETLLQRSLRLLREAQVDRVWVGVSPANEALVRTSASTDQTQAMVVGETATMSETVSRMLPVLARKFVLLMPDTYWTSQQWSVRDLSTALDRYPVAVMVWRIRNDQFGKLGQCRVVDGEVVEHRDKDPTCRFEYSWGVIGWQADVTTLLRPETPHVGYLLDAALKAGLKVGALVCNDTSDVYFDCGTPSEYFRLVRATSNA